MPPKKFVNIQVIKHLPLGLEVEAEDGTRGLVRLRELSWVKNQLLEWEILFPIGWQGKAIRKPSLRSKNIEYSLRLTEEDPFDRLQELISIQQIFGGIVTGVMDYGIFIDVIPGVTGLLHRSQLPEWACKKTVNETFWLGDHINVTVREIKKTERQVLLSLSPISLMPRGSTHSQKNGITTHKSKPSLSTLFSNNNFPKKHVLIVEDEPEQSKALSEWLERLGQYVDVVESAEKALDFLAKEKPELAIIDVGLPKMMGTELATIILDRYPGILVVSSTDWTRADDLAGTLNTLQNRGVELLIKPVLPEDLIDLFKKINDGGLPISVEEVKSPILADIATPKQSDSLHMLLNRCRKHVGFETAILFCMDPDHRMVSIVDYTGDLPFEENAASILVYSPVRDVAEDHEEVVVSEIQASDNDRFRHLLELVPWMVSCVGIPVPSHLQMEYALFLIGRKPRKVTAEQRLYIDAMALAIGTYLEHNKFKEQSTLIQRTALIGQLTRAMVHEINNLVGPLSSRLDNMQSNIERLEKSKDTEQKWVSREQLLINGFEEIQRNFKKIVNTTRMFRRVVAKGRNEILRVDEIINETIDLLRDTSDRAHIRIIFLPPPQLVIIRNQGAVLEQVLLNVILNALQQIAELRPDTGGWVQVWIEQNCDSINKGFIRILIEDNGPGIHTNLWEKIFNVGYSTREDGSGIGLYISRNLFDSIGGRIYVQESIVMSGTIFALEIPCHL